MIKFLKVSIAPDEFGLMSVRKSVAVAAAKAAQRFCSKRDRYLWDTHSAAREKKSAKRRKRTESAAHAAR